MSIEIKPQEFQLAETRNPFSVRTSAPKEKIEALLLPHVRRNRLDAGDHIEVQVLNHTMDVLLHQAKFVVASAVETEHRTLQADGTEKTFRARDYVIERVEEWWNSGAVQPEASDAFTAENTYAGNPGTTKWNVGKRAHDVIIGGEIVASVPDKEQAEAIANGTAPVPVAA